MHLQVRLLGQAEIFVSDRPVTLRGQKPLALLAYLLINKKAHSRTHLAALLFAEANDPLAALRWSLFHLRKKIGHAYFLADKSQIQVDFTKNIELDLDALVAGETAVFQHPLLDGLYIQGAPQYMDWLYFEREQTVGIFQTHLQERLEAYEAAADFDAVVETAQRLLQTDNLREAWHQALIRAYANQGKWAAAQAQYENCARLFQEELGITPDVDTTALLAQVQARERPSPLTTQLVPRQVALAKLPPNLQTAAAATPATLFVARKSYLQALHQTLAQVTNGQGQIRFVVGEAGQGKTSLLTEFARQAQERYPNLLVAVSQGTYYTESEVPHLLFQDLLDCFLGNMEHLLARGLLSGQQATRLWQNIPTFLTILVQQGPHLVGPFLDRATVYKQIDIVFPDQAAQLKRPLNQQAATDSLQNDQTNRLHQIESVLATLSDNTPLLLIVDDLHWADSATLTILFHLARRIANKPIFILGSYRPEETIPGENRQRHPLTKLSLELQRHFGEITFDLDATDAQENHHFVNQIIDSEANALDERFRRSLFQQTEGHPMFTLEVLRMLQSNGTLYHNAAGQWVAKASLNWDRLPARVEAVIGERLDRLDGMSQQLIEVGCIEGASFTVEVLARVIGHKPRQIMQQLAQVLEKQHRLVKYDGERQIGAARVTHFRFTHALYRSYVYNHVLYPGERRLLHGEIAEELERLHGENTAVIAAELARHFHRAGLNQKAIHYSQIAGERAAAQHALKEAEQFFTQAIEHTSEIQKKLRFQLHLARERCREHLGLREAQLQDLQTLAQLAADIEDITLSVEADLRYALFTLQGNDIAQTISLCQALIDKTTQARHSTSIQARIYLIWGRALLQKGSLTEATAHLEQALRLSREGQLLQLEATSLRSFGVLAEERGEFTEAEAYFNQSLSLNQTLGHRRGEGSALKNLGEVALARGQFETAKTVCEQALKIFRQVAYRPGEADTFYQLSAISFELGNGALARAYAKKAYSLFQKIGDESGQTNTLLIQGQIAYFQQKNFQALAYCQQVLDLFDAKVQPLAKCRLYLCMGKTALAQQMFTEANGYFEQASTILAADPATKLQTLVWSGMAEMSQRQDEAETAVSFIEKALPNLQSSQLPPSRETVASYWTCYQILAANKDSRAPALLQAAANRLHQTAAQIESDRLRAGFLAIPVHKQILEQVNLVDGTS